VTTTKGSIVKFIPLIPILLLAGCATAGHDQRASLLAEPVNCQTADADIAALEAAIPSRGERARSAVGTLTPVGLVAGVATGSYRDRAAVLTGRTAGELTARVQEIRQTCGRVGTTANADQGGT
jgi:uncharacterized lipoprotein YajG